MKNITASKILKILLTSSVIMIVSACPKDEDSNKQNNEIKAKEIEIEELKKQKAELEKERDTLSSEKTEQKKDLDKKIKELEDQIANHNNNNNNNNDPDNDGNNGEVDAPKVDGEVDEETKVVNNNVNIKVDNAPVEQPVVDNAPNGMQNDAPKPKNAMEKLSLAGKQYSFKKNNVEYKGTVQEDNKIENHNNQFGIQKIIRLEKDGSYSVNIAGKIVVTITD